jgi:esterase/lipase superfamily enzyme
MEKKRRLLVPKVNTLLDTIERIKHGNKDRRFQNQGALSDNEIVVISRETTKQFNSKNSSDYVLRFVPLLRQKQSNLEQQEKLFRVYSRLRSLPAYLSIFAKSNPTQITIEIGTVKSLGIDPSLIYKLEPLFKSLPNGFRYSEESKDPYPSRYEALVSKSYNQNSEESTESFSNDLAFGLDILNKINKLISGEGFYERQMKIKGHISRDRHAPNDRENLRRRPPQPVQADRIIKFETDLSEEIPPHYQYTVYFGTNREQNNYNGSTQFLNIRGEKLILGKCLVNVPKIREFGSIGSNFFRRFIKGDDRIKLDSIEVLSEQNVIDEINTLLSQNELKRREILVFEQAAIRTAQMAFDLKAPSAAFFSWPSGATFEAYPADESTIDASEIFIKEFFEFLGSNFPDCDINLIVHSMGNRGVVRALDKMANMQTQNIKFNQIYLAAPDIDTELFKQLAGVYSQLAAQTTLYISDKDKAVKLSKFLHTYPRVGVAPPVTIINGIDTILVKKKDLIGIWHDYYAESEPMLYDINSSLRGDKADDRIRLKRVDMLGGLHHWILE